jgi:hypothetical protein
VTPGTSKVTSPLACARLAPGLSSASCRRCPVRPLLLGAALYRLPGGARCCVAGRWGPCRLDLLPCVRSLVWSPVLSFPVPASRPLTTFASPSFPFTSPVSESFQRPGRHERARRGSLVVVTAAVSCYLVLSLRFLLGLLSTWALPRVFVLVRVCTPARGTSTHSLRLKQPRTLSFFPPHTPDLRRKALQVAGEGEQQ